MKEGIECLPEEIQAYILSKVDGGSLARCRKVCILWRELIDGQCITLYLC